jgi:hypothetical protein
MAAFDPACHVEGEAPFPPEEYADRMARALAVTAPATIPGKGRP